MNKLKRTLLIIGTFILIGCNSQPQESFEVRGKTLEVHLHRSNFYTVVEIDSIVYTIRSNSAVSTVGREFKCTLTNRLLTDLQYGTFKSAKFIRNCRHE